VSYFLYCMATFDRARNGVGAPVKIGIAAEPSKRLSTIQTSCPTRVDIAFQLQCFNSECARILESNVHAALTDKRTNGEWFSISPAEAADVAIKCYDLFLLYGAAKDLMEFDELRSARQKAGIEAVEQALAGIRYIDAWESLAA
jgi:hypothetical protein